MNWKVKSALGIAASVLAAQATAQITFYEGDNFHGRAFTTDQRVWDFDRYGFGDRASSVVIDSGRWEVCSEQRFEGDCVFLRRGAYSSLRQLGLNNRISSARPVNRERETNLYDAPAPLPAPTYEYRQRPRERIFEAPVTSVRAVMGTPEQRCWVEREQVAENGGDVGRAVIGGLIGGVLGHQVGGGRGRDAATAVGAIAGAVIGSNSGRRDSYVTDRDVQRCRTVSSGTPQYWDVRYIFRGIEHRLQMSAPPGDTISVNVLGEPRQ